MNRPRLRRCYFLLACVVVFQFATESLPAQATNSKPFEPEILAFEASDKTNPPPTNAILFVGSSSIRKWTTLAKDFPNHKVINRGFGGSEISDSIFYADRIVIPYKPRMIVFFAGSNDIDAGKSSEQVFDDFKAFVQKVRAALPRTRIAFISITTSPLRYRQVEKVKKANQLISAYIAQAGNMAYIDTFPATLNPDGKPNPDFFVADRLHMNASGYALWTKVVAPYLEETP